MSSRARSIRSKASTSVSPAKTTPKKTPTTTKSGSRSGRGKKVINVDDSDAGDDAILSSSPDEEEGVKQYDSDALDDESAEDATSKKRKRKSASMKKTKPTRSPRKKTKKAVDSDEEVEDEFDLKEGQEIVGVVVQAPKTGRGE